jgi:hypothetical protein
MKIEQLALFSLTSDEPDRFPRMIKPGWLEARSNDIPFWHQPIIRWPDGSITGEVETALETPRVIKQAGRYAILEHPDGSITHGDHVLRKPRKEIAPNFSARSIDDKEIAPNSESELGAIDWIPCASINPDWTGGIERKKIKGRYYFYWRYMEGKHHRSKYLSADWSKAVAKLAPLQSAAWMPKLLPKSPESVIPFETS